MPSNRCQGIVQLLIGGFGKPGYSVVARAWGRRGKRAREDRDGISLSSSLGASDT